MHVNTETARGRETLDGAVPGPRCPNVPSVPGQPGSMAPTCVRLGVRERARHRLWLWFRACVRGSEKVSNAGSSNG